MEGTPIKGTACVKAWIMKGQPCEVGTMITFTNEKLKLSFDYKQHRGGGSRLQDLESLSPLHSGTCALRFL